MPTSTALMGLKIPNPGETDYSTSVSDSFNDIDDHDHSAGKGTPVVTDGIADLAVTTAKINALAVTTAKIDALAVTTAKIAALNVTRAKIEAVGQQVATLALTFSTSSTSKVDVTGMSVSLTTSGRPVIIGVFGGDVNGNMLSAVGTDAGLAILRDATEIVDVLYPVGAHSFSYIAIDAPGAGTYTYKLQTYASGGGSTAQWSAGVKIFAYEL